MIHNHFTRDIKKRGECPACDRFHNIQRMKRKLYDLEEYRKKIEAMTSCHIVEHGFCNMTLDYSPTFYGDKDKICHGLDAAGDLSGGFALIKQGLLKEIDFDINSIKKEIGMKDGIDKSSENSN